ncbi:MAG TPA: YciI family protein [Rhodoferax sp.]
MLFIVQFEDIYADHPERLPERAQHMPAHLAFLAAHPSRIIASGALRDEADGIPHGGIWILKAQSKAEAVSFYQADPFWQAGLRKSVRVSHWAKAFWSPAFTECVRGLKTA